jgi:hypothetical protein
MDKRKEITKMMDEWKDEANGRSVFAIMADEHDNTILHCTGRRIDIITALVSAIKSDKDIHNDIKTAMLFARTIRTDGEVEAGVEARI